MSLSRCRFVAWPALLVLLTLTQATGVRAQSDPFAALVAAAKQEGAIVIDGPSLDAAREALVQGFEGAYGIQVSYISSGSAASAARVRAERAAGKYLLDVFVSGSDTPLQTFLPNGWLDRIEPALSAPDVIDRSKWKDGHLWYGDPDRTILRVIQYVNPEVAINTKLVKSVDVATWKSMVDPKWRGKIIAKDPAIPGSGASLVSYFYIQFGPDFVRKLYKDGAPRLSRDPRQSVQWLAQGDYPIWIGADPTMVQQFQRLGYPVAFVFPADAPQVLSGGWGMIGLLNKAPHPNAAKLFVNWLAGRQGLSVLARATGTPGLRTDLSYDFVPAYMLPKKGAVYADAYDYKFVTEQREAAFQKVRDLLGL